MAKDVIDTLDDLIRQAGLRVVFWTCPRGCRGFVDWAKDADGKKTPTCRECGEVGAPR